MISKIKFVKAVASGNDFIIIDRSGVPGSASQAQMGKLARQLCQRKLSVGADGLLLIEPSKKNNFKMRIFNPDGSEVNMCGNGSRCAALYAHKSGLVSGRKMAMETRAGNLKAEIKESNVNPALACKGWVKVMMSPPKNLRLKFDLNINGTDQSLNFINTGVPHVVCFAPSLDKFNVHETGSAIRYDPEFQPEGTNADFVEVLDEDHIRLRTYERGVEEETSACGTGAVAAGIITTYDMHEKPKGAYKVRVQTQSGQTLKVYFEVKKGVIDQVYLEGKAQIVYKGEMEK